MRKLQGMTEQTTPLEKLQLNGRYYRCLIRHGYTTIEQIENYLSDKNAEPLSKNIANMSPRGDYEVADSIHYYRTGQHLPRPSGIDAMTIKKMMKSGLSKCTGNYQPPGNKRP